MIKWFKNKKNKIKAKKFFDKLKNNKQKMTTEDLELLKNNTLYLMEKALSIGQSEMAEKLYFYYKCMELEKELLKLGIDRYVYKSEIDNFITNVKGRVVKIIELSRYEREIPIEIIEKINKTKDIFDDFIIVFTDYTGEFTKQANEKRKLEKDPICFGVFKNKETKIINERLYFIGDWIDEYCDLTLDKLINELKKDPIVQITIPTNLEELKKEVNKNNFKQVRTEIGVETIIK